MPITPERRAELRLAAIAIGRELLDEWLAGGVVREQDISRASTVAALRTIDAATDEAGATSAIYALLAEQETRRRYIPVRTLATEKARILILVDVETRRRIALGFTHSGKTFSLSTESQLNWIGAKATGFVLTYPYTISTLDGSDSLVLASTAEAGAMFDAAFVAKEARIAAGRTVGLAVNAATTIAAAEAAAAAYLAGT